VSRLASQLAFGGVPKFGALMGGLFASLVCTGVAFGAETAKVPNFAPDSLTGWQLMDDEFIPPPSGPGPVVSDPAHPYIDYQTPHTDQLHVVERFHLIEDSKMLEVNVHVEDPGAFTTPWNAIQRYRRTDRSPLSEVVCAENNGDHFNHGLEPMPQTGKPDF